MEIVVIAVFVVAFIAAAWFAHKAAAERRRALAELAARLGLRFYPDEDDGHDDDYAQFEIFRRGHSRVARNTLSGALELFGRPCAVRAGDFRYKVTSGSGKSRSTRTHRFSYLIVQPPWQTPPLLIRREGVMDKIAGAFGFDDIDFESVEFSKRFYVKSSDKRFAYDVLHPRMMEFLLASEPLMLDLEGGALCISDGSRCWDPAGFEQQIAFVRQFCELWPRHLLATLEA